MAYGNDCLTPGLARLAALDAGDTRRSRIVSKIRLYQSDQSRPLDGEALSGCLFKGVKEDMETRCGRQDHGIMRRLCAAASLRPLHQRVNRNNTTCRPASL